MEKRKIISVIYPKVDTEFEEEELENKAEENQTLKRSHILFKKNKEFVLTDKLGKWEMKSMFEDDWEV